MESQLIIDNQTVAAQSGATFTRNHPKSSEVVTSAAACCSRLPMCWIPRPLIS